MDNATELLTFYLQAEAASPERNGCHDPPAIWMLWLDFGHRSESAR